MRRFDFYECFFWFGDPFLEYVEWVFRIDRFQNRFLGVATMLLMLLFLAFHSPLACYNVYRFVVSSFYLGQSNYNVDYFCILLLC